MAKSIRDRWLTALDIDADYDPRPEPVALHVSPKDRDFKSCANCAWMAVSECKNNEKCVGLDEWLPMATSESDEIVCHLQCDDCKGIEGNDICDHMKHKASQERQGCIDCGHRDRENGTCNSDILCHTADQWVLEVECCNDHDHCADCPADTDNGLCSIMKDNNYHPLNVDPTE